LAPRQAHEGAGAQRRQQLEGVGHRHAWGQVLSVRGGGGQSVKVSVVLIQERIEQRQGHMLNPWPE
jgi:hypothetical protein